MTDGAIRSIQAIDMGSRKNRLIRMLSYFRPFVGLVALAGLMAVIVNVAELVSPYIMKIAIDDYIMGDNADMGIGTIAVLYFASVAVGSVSNYAYDPAQYDRAEDHSCHQNGAVFTHSAHAYVLLRSALVRKDLNKGY